MFAVACGGSAKHSPEPVPTTKPVASPAASKPTQVDAKALKSQLEPFIDSLSQGLGDAHKFSGFVFVAQGDKVVYERAWGYANYATKALADRNTSFRIGSVTKQFTAVAILQLQDKGLLSVHDKVRKHLPKYPAVADKVTIHHLLTHTGGVPNFTNDRALMKRRGNETSVPDLLATFSAKKLDFEPGSKFSYSNSGYAVLGAIIEAVSKKSYHDYLRDHVFTPAGLTRTLYGDAKGADNRAKGYREHNGKLAPAKKFAMSMAYAAGGVRSTAADLWRWHKAIETDAILSAAARKQMYTPFKKNYAYGWAVRDVKGKRIIAHDGGIDGFSTSYLRLVTDDVTIVAWTNNPGQPAGAAARSVAQIVMGKKVKPLTFDAIPDALAKRVIGSYVPDKESAERLTKLAGKQMLESVAVMDIERRGAGLVSNPIGQPALPLSHKKGLVFELKRVRATFTFKSATPDGVATGFSLSQGGATFSFVRDETKAAAIKAKRKAP